MEILKLLFVAIAFILIFGTADAAPYQELVPRKGYVPVYIRYGETPLSEIHPKLAEAFKEDETVPKDKIASADLIAVKNESTDQTNPKETDSKDSDIASFDVVKAKDNDNDKDNN